MTIEVQLLDTPSSFRAKKNRRRDRGERSDQSLYTAAQLIEATVDHMRRHLGTPLKVSTLSLIVGCSNSRFHTLFKSVTGCSPKKFFTRLQMQRACELLAGNTVSVKEVALVLGYTNPFYFSHVFKLAVGIAPNHYRRKMIRSSGRSLGSGKFRLVSQALD